MELINPKIINELVKDIGAENTRDFISTLQEEISNRCTNIRNARDRSEFKVLAQEAHAFKGAALTYGALTLGNMLSQLEKLARTEHDAAYSLVDEVLETARLTQSAYRRLEIKDS